MAICLVCDFQLKTCLVGDHECGLETDTETMVLVSDPTLCRNRDGNSEFNGSTDDQDSNREGQHYRKLPGEQ